MKRRTRPKEAATSAGAPRFDVTALHEMGGDQVLARGQKYYAEGRVQIITIGPKRVAASVVGAEAYRVELHGQGRNFQGDCTCRAFEDEGFCKHLVALALAVNARGPSGANEAARRHERIRTHLIAQGTEVLADMVLRLAENDSALFRELELAAAMDAGDDDTLFARLDAAIVEATDTPAYIGYREARDWAAGVAKVLDQIEGLSERGKAQLVLRLLDRLLDRMALAVQAVDDSSGHAGAVHHRAAELHLAACRDVRPDPRELARTLFKREIGSPGDVFYAANETYAKLLGRAGRAEYRRLAEEAWAEHQPRTAGKSRNPNPEPADRLAVRAILERFAEADGDVDALIALRAKDLTWAHDYLDLAELCLAHRRNAEALRWAEEGLWRFDRDPDLSLVSFAAKLYGRMGREAEAEALLWQAFERHLSLGIHEQLKALARGNPAAQSAVTDKAVMIIENRITAEARTPARHSWVQWEGPSDLLVELLVRERRVEAALGAARAHGCGERVLGMLAKACEETHPAEAIALYGDLVERSVRKTLQHGYEEAHGHVGRMQELRDRLGEGAAHAAYVEDLLHRHKAKRNFVKLMTTQPRSRTASSR